MNSSTSARCARFASFELDLRTGELHKHGLKVKLYDQPFQVLAMLLERPGEVVTRDELQHRLWPADTFVDFDVGLNTAVKRLRDALGESAETPQYVETLPRRGYRFIAEVVLSGENGHSPHEPVSSSISNGPHPVHVLPETEIVRPVRRWLALGAVAFAVLMLLAVVMNVGGARRLFTSKAASRQIHFVAVRPFDNLTGDASQEYFAEGLTDGLTTELAQLSPIPVMSRTSAMSFKGSKKPLKDVARELNVDAVLEGSVQRDGDKVEINVQLIEAATDSHLWAKSYSGTLRELPALHREIARDTVGRLNFPNNQQNKDQRAAPHLVHPEAYEAYLLGRFYANKRTPEALRQSEGFLKQAIEKDPGYAAAYSQLAEVYALTGASMAATVLPSEALEKARTTAMKALELDNTQAEAHVVLARVKDILDWDEAGAEREFRTAIQLNPNSAVAYHFYALFKGSRGKGEESCALIERARRLDPLSPNILRNVATCLALVRHRYEEALIQARKAVELGPGNYNTRMTTSVILFEMGRYQESLLEVQEADKLSKGHPLTRAAVAIVQAKLGRKAETEGILRELMQPRGSAPLPAWQIARIHLALGHNEEAVRWLEKAIDMHSFVPLHLIYGTDFDPLRTDPRFQSLLRRLGLPAKAPPS